MSGNAVFYNPVLYVYSLVPLSDKELLKNFLQLPGQDRQPQTPASQTECSTSAFSPISESPTDQLGLDESEAEFSKSGRLLSSGTLKVTSIDHWAILFSMDIYDLLRR